MAEDKEQKKNKNKKEDFAKETVEKLAGKVNVGLTPEYIKKIKKARREVEEGKTYTLEEVEEKLNL